jgi:hypothetical protein
VNYTTADYLARAVQEDRLQRARRARLLRSAAPGLHRTALKRLTASAARRFSRSEPTSVCVPCVSNAG